MAMQQITSNFVYFGLRQVLGETAEQVVQSIGDYFTDPSRKLPRALERANEKAWKTLELALLGSTWTGKLKNWIVKGDIRAIRLPIESVITQKERENRNFRKHCIQELQSVRDNGLDPILSTDLDELKERTLSFKCFTDASALLEDSWKVMENVSQSLAETGCPSLAELIGYRTADGSPLLVVAFGFFLREEIVSDPILRDELLFDQMKQIWKPQAPSFVEIEKTMKELGEQFERSVTEARDTLLHALGEIYEQGERTFSAVLDIDESLRELNADQQETRRCLKEIRGLLSHMKAQSGEIKPRLSFSLRNDYEKIQVKELLNQSRCLPPDQQRCPALQNGLAKLQVAVGEFDEAEKRFCELENQVDHPSVKAELLFNAYQTALENKKWKEALSYLTQSAQLDPTHFARFPMEKYPAEKILGAGGFGVVFLCQHQYLRRKVAIKTYYCDDLARKFENIFNEAQILSQLNYPSLIQVHDCGYADSEKKYPFMVMEYFPGEDLEEYIQKRGTLSIDETVSLAREIAKTIQIAHKEGILHRDLKPENILVHKNNNNGNNGDDWKLKIIDFGLALNISVLEKEYALRSRGKSMLGSSVSGTYLYAPPEQRGELSAPIQPYSDIYAFGKTLCYLLFQTTDITLTHWRKIGDHPLAELINGCIHKNPQDRFQSFDAVLESLKHKTSSSESSRLQEVAKPQGKEPPKLRRTDVCALDSPKPQGKEPPKIETVWPYLESDLFVREVKELYKKYEGQGGCYFGKNIPDKKLRNACNSFIECDENTLVYLLIDTTFFGSNKTGLALTSDGIYWTGLSESQRGKTSLEEFTNTDIIPISNNEFDILIGNHPVPFCPSGCGTERDQIVSLLKDFQFLFKSVYSEEIDFITVSLPNLPRGAKPLDMVLIPAGTFLMGSPENEKNRYSDEGPQHQVTISRPFYMGKFPVTQAQWQAVMGNNPSRNKGDNRPVETVSWNDCQEFIKRLNQRGQGTFRLPTEAEWEYACRSGTHTRFYWGDDPNIKKIDQYAWYVGNSGRQTHVVGLKEPNAWGLYDMCGNVWEWCEDRYDENYYTNSPKTDPVNIQSKECRVLRGGSSSARYCRSANRDWDYPSYSFVGWGFRVCRTL